LGLATIPFARKYNEWRAADDPSRTPLHTTGLIQEVEEVTTIDPFPGDSSDGDEWDTEMAVVQRYAIVVVRYTPQGYSESILGVDAVDVDESSAPLLVNSEVDLSYAATETRTVRLPGRTRNHHIRNPMAWLREQLLSIAVAVGMLLLISGIGNWWQHRLTKRTLPVPH
jgi:hypothetical protein